MNRDYRYVAPSYPTNQNRHVHNRGVPQQGNYKYADVFKWVKETFADENKALDIL
jgi:hypothetical protein